MAALRNGTWKTIPSRGLVLGDIVHIRAGGIVPADIEIINGTVSVNESALTGESVDATKETGKTIFSASTISHGEAIARVCAAGTKSSYGKTAEAESAALLTRTRDHFWSFEPSKWVGGMAAINVALAALMASFGWVMTAVSFLSIIILLVITIVAMLMLDSLKMWYYRVTGILGTERHS